MILSADYPEETAKIAARATMTRRPSFMTIAKRVGQRCN